MHTQKIGRCLRIPDDAIRKQEGTALAANADEHGPGGRTGRGENVDPPSVFSSRG
jgi:hypothetical protein